MRYLMEKLRKFKEDCAGVVAIELVIFLPAMFVVISGMAVFFDAYRARSVSEKAAFTISDLLSRETNAINETYIDNTMALYESLSKYGSNGSIRVSVVTWSDREDAYELEWSKVRGTAFEELTDADMTSLEDRLPIMSDQDTVILVETNMVYLPPLDVGVSNINIGGFVFNRPRYASQLIFES